jgi:hypothetical protein
MNYSIFPGDYIVSDITYYQSSVPFATRHRWLAELKYLLMPNANLDRVGEGGYAYDLIHIKAKRDWRPWDGT